MSVPKGGYYYIGKFRMTADPLPIPEDVRNRATEILRLIGNGVGPKRYYLSCTDGVLPAAEYNVNWVIFVDDFSTIQFQFSDMLLILNLSSGTYTCQVEEE